MKIGWHDNALHNRRQWLGKIQPDREDLDDDTGYTFRWGDECDTAIAARRSLDPALEAVFAVAEQDGIAIVPAYNTDSHGRVPHQLMEIAYSCDDTDWIIVTRRETHADYTADTMAESSNSVLVRSSFEQHHTPTWCIRIAHH